MPLTHAILLQLLSRCPLLQGLDEARIQNLMQPLQVSHFRKGAMVLQQNDPADALCFLLEGRLKVVSFTSSGREIGLSVIEPVTHFGEMALIDSQPRSASVVAASKALVGFMPKSAALRLLEEPNISMRLMRDLVQMLRNANQQLLLLGYQHAQTRIAALLLDTLQVYSRSGLTDGAPLSQQDIANMTNTTRETVSRVLTQLLDAGILKRDGRRLFIADVDRLRQTLLERG